MNKLQKTFCLLSIFLIMFAYHNIDLAFNMSNAPTCIDYNGFVFQSKIDLYRSGVYGLMVSICFLILTLVVSFND